MCYDPLVLSVSDEERIGAKRKKKLQHFNNFFDGGGGGGGLGNFFARGMCLHTCTRSSVLHVHVHVCAVVYTLDSHVNSNNKQV